MWRIEFYASLMLCLQLSQPLLSVVSFPTAVQRYNKKRQFVPIVQRFGVDCSIVYHKLLIFSIDFGISQMTKKSSFSSDESSWMPYPFSGLNFSTWRGKYFFYATQIEKRREGAYIITRVGARLKPARCVMSVMCHECH